MKKAIIVHGWDGSPQGDWIPYLKKELEENGFQVNAVSMPDPEYPKIGPWVDALSEAVKNPDKETIFIGHSIGCQAILRFFEKLAPGVKVGHVFFVAPWIHLKGLEDKEAEEIAKPWLETPIDWTRVKEKAQNFTAIFSDNDPYVYLDDAEIFKKELGAKIILEHERGHLNQKELPTLVETIKK